MPEIPPEHDDFKRPGFLLASQRAWLAEEKEISESYEYKMKNQIREGVAGAMDDFALLNDSGKVDDDIREAIVRNKMYSEFDETVHDESDIKADSLSSAAGVAEFLGQMFAGESVEGTADIITGSTESVKKLLHKKHSQNHTPEQLLTLVLREVMEQSDSDVPKEDLIQIVEAIDKDELVQEIKRSW